MWHSSNIAEDEIENCFSCSSIGLLVCWLLTAIFIRHSFGTFCIYLFMIISSLKILIVVTFISLVFFFLSHYHLCHYYCILSLKMEWIFTLFVTDVTPCGVTSVITSFGVNIKWTGRDSTRRVVNFHSTGVRIEWNSLLNEWNFFTPINGVNYSLDFFFLESTN